MKNENKNGRPCKAQSPFTSIFRSLISGKTQQEVADRVGVSRQNVGKWLSGETTPDINTLGKIADAYNVTTDYLLGRTKIKTQNINEQAVCKFTGLSEGAVRRLRNLCETTDSKANDLISELITSSLFQLALIDILKAIDYCKISNSIKNTSDSKKELIEKSILLIEEYGYTLREPSDNAHVYANQAYEAFKYIIDDLISSVAEINGCVLRCNDMAFDTFVDTFKKGGD